MSPLWDYYTIIMGLSLYVYNFVCKFEKITEETICRVAEEKAKG